MSGYGIRAQEECMPERKTAVDCRLKINNIKEYETEHLIAGPCCHDCSGVLLEHKNRKQYE